MAIPIRFQQSLQPGQQRAITGGGMGVTGLGFAGGGPQTQSPIMNQQAALGQPQPLTH